MTTAAAASSASPFASPSSLGSGTSSGVFSGGSRMSGAGSKKPSLASNHSSSASIGSNHSSNNHHQDRPPSVHDLVPAGMVRAAGEGGGGSSSSGGGGGGMPVISPAYTKVGESFRHTVPHEMQCSMFCGGRKCKYEGGSHWRPDQMALAGIYSHWVTDGLLAMARPNTKLLREGGLMDEFKRHGIR